MLDDGSLSQADAQQRDLFQDLQQTRGASRFTGENLRPVLTSPVGTAAGSTAGPAAPALQDTRAGGVGSALAQTPEHGTEDQDDDDDAGDVDSDMLGMLDSTESPDKKVKVNSGVAAPQPAKIAAGGATAKQAARAKTKSVSAPMPPSLVGGSGGAGAKRKGGAGSVPSLSGDKLAASADNKIEKAEQFLQDFERSERAALQLEKDKAFYKKVSLHVQQLESLQDLLPRDKASQIQRQVKLLNLMVPLIKDYKMWLKNGKSKEYLLERQRLRDFENSEPPVEIGIPACIMIDELEMEFSVGVDDSVFAEASDADARAAMAGLFKGVSYERHIFTRETAAAFQMRIVEACIIGLFRIVGDPRQESEMAVCLSKLQRFLSGLPQEGEVAGFCLEEAIDSQLQPLRRAFGFNDMHGRTEEVAGTLFEIERSAKSIHQLFQSMAQGGKLLKMAKV